MISSEQTSTPPRIAIPALAGTNIYRITACSNLKNQGAGKVALREAGLESEGLVALEPTTGTVVDLWKKPLEKGHLHIVCFDPKSSHNKDAPPAEAEEKDFQKLMAGLIGEDVSVTTFCRFMIPVAQLPEKGLIRAAIESMRLQVEDIAIQQTGASFSVSGAETALRSIEWQVAPPDQVDVTIRFRKQTTVSPSYLVDVLSEGITLSNQWLMGRPNAANAR